MNMCLTSFSMSKKSGGDCYILSASKPRLYIFIIF